LAEVRFHQEEDEEVQRDDDDGHYWKAPRWVGVGDRYQPKHAPSIGSGIVIDEEGRRRAR
jgi:hypothetical protein